MKTRHEVQTVEQTAKSLKAQQVLSYLMLLMGILLLVLCFWSGEQAGAVIGGVIALLGMLWLWITRIRIWWNHK